MSTGYYTVATIAIKSKFKKDQLLKTQVTKRLDRKYRKKLP